MTSSIWADIGRREPLAQTLARLEWDAIQKGIDSRVLQAQQDLGTGESAMRNRIEFLEQWLRRH